MHGEELQLQHVQIKMRKIWFICSSCERHPELTILRQEMAGMLPESRLSRMIHRGWACLRENPSKLDRLDGCVGVQTVYKA